MSLGIRRAPRARLLAACALAALLTACAQPPRSTPAQADHWSGRLAVAVEGMPQHSFHAGFELSGTPEAGTLQLLSPLGSSIALLQWQPGQATLRRTDQTQSAASLAELVQQLTGSALPVAALFGWLHGQAVAASGWRADLSGLEQGRLTAERDTPPPRTTLRLVLD